VTDGRLHRDDGNDGGIFAPPLRAHGKGYGFGAGCANQLANCLAIIPQSAEMFSLAQTGMVLPRRLPIGERDCAGRVRRHVSGEAAS